MANSSEDLRVELHTFQTPDSKDTQPGAGLWVCAKRYTTPSSTRNTEGLTLLFTHCNGSHKEEWDLVISRLFALQTHKPESARIREAWSFDRQNHGDAAVLNAHALVKRGDTVSLYEWAHALRSFIDSPLLRGHHLVALGHSAGATAWMLTTFSPPPIPYTALFLIEPTITPQHIFERELAERQSYMDLVVQLTLNRKSEWKTKDAAYAYFKKRIPWSMWDDRAVRMFVEHGLHDAPDVRRGVTLKWTKEQEAASYPDTKPHHESAVQLAKISKAVPVHLIWGERVEFMPEYLRDALSDQNEGMDVASVSYVEDGGHMVVQEKPDALAEVIAAKLDSLTISVVGGSRAKL